LAWLGLSSELATYDQPPSIEEVDEPEPARRLELEDAIVEVSRSAHIHRWPDLSDAAEAGGKLGVSCSVADFDLCVRQEGALGGCFPPTAGRWCCACDNGPEFVAFELTERLEELGAATFHIDPGKPWQNTYGESLGARLRDECLNEHLFLSLAEARETIDRWRHDYNHLRPHGSLGALTPTEFALLKGPEHQPPQEGETTDRLYL